MMKLELGRKETERILSWYEFLNDAKCADSEDFSVYEKVKAAYDKYCAEPRT